MRSTCPRRRRAPGPAKPAGDRRSGRVRRRRNFAERYERARRETSTQAQAGLIAVYATNLADQVAANIKATNRIVSKATDMDADQLAADMKQAENEQAATSA